MLVQSNFARTAKAIALTILVTTFSSFAATGESSLEDMERQTKLEQQCSTLKGPGKLKACSEAVELARKNDMGLSLLLDMRASVYEDMKDFGRALVDRNEMIKLAPQSTYPLHKRAQTHEKKGDWNSALADYDASLKLKANDSITYNARARAHLAKGSFELAIADFTKSIALTDAYYAASTIIERGDAYRVRKDLDRAIADYDQAIRISPDYIVAYYNRGLAKRAKGDEAGAQADIAIARKVNPKIGN